MNKKILFLVTLLVCLGIAKPALAHQPNFIGTQVKTLDREPEISKAYYAELTGTPGVYNIISKTEFSLYIGILSPDIPGAEKNYQVTILNKYNQIISSLNNPSVPWEPWYETFAGDSYWKGPEFKQTLPAGTYRAVVTNPNNKGKYVLAIGETESFPPSQTFHTISEIYKTKTQFFNKSPFSIFGGIIGKYLLIFVLVVLILLGLIIWFVKRKFFKK